MITLHLTEAQAEYTRSMLWREADTLHRLAEEENDEDYRELFNLVMEVYNKLIKEYDNDTNK